MNIYIYIHVCCINNWIEILYNLLNKIKCSGLYDNIDEIRCCILGNYENNKLFDDPKIKIIAQSDDLSLYEVFTINKLYEDSLIEDFKVLYIHTKGLNHNGKNICVLDWVEYISHFNINNYDTCLKLLDNFDTVGVNLQVAHNKYLHYSGNFWWSKSSYIKKLEKCIYYSYNAPEFWITEKKIGKYICLWKSDCNDHYTDRYTSDKYINKEMNQIFCYN